MTKLVARLVTQVCGDGDTNFVFILDPLATVEECVVHGGKWADATIDIHSVTVECDGKAAAILGTREFRCVDNLEDQL